MLRNATQKLTTLPIIKKSNKKADYDLSDLSERGSREYRDYVLKNIEGNLETLANCGWIAPHTLQTVLNSLNNNNLTVNVDTTTNSKSSYTPSQQSPIPPPPVERPPAYEPSQSAPIPKWGEKAGLQHQFTNGNHITRITSSLNNIALASDSKPPPLPHRALEHTSSTSLPRSLTTAPINKIAPTTTIKSLSRAATTVSPPIAPKPNRKKIVVATNDFEAVEEEDLGFVTGDLIAVIEDVDDNWYRGTLRGKSGIFPKNFVQDRT